MRITGDLSFGKGMTALEYMIWFLNQISAEVAEKLSSASGVQTLIISEGALNGLDFPDIPGAEPESVSVALLGSNIGFAGGELPSGSGTITQFKIFATVDGKLVKRIIDLPEPVALDDLLAETARSVTSGHSIEDYPGFATLVLPPAYWLDEQGTASADRIKGFATDDFLDGNGGKDIVDGKGGDDEIDGGGGKDRLLGGPGADEVNGGRGNDVVKGGPGGDTVAGGGGNDRLFGGGGDDTITANAGRDQIRGNKGDDVLIGGPGADTFFFRRGDGDDTIENFDPDEDFIRITGLKKLGQLEFEQVGDDVVISYANITITVEDVTKAEMRDADIFGL